MTTLISISTLQIVSRDQLQQMFPNTSFVPDFSVVSTADWLPYGVAPLVYTNQPSSTFSSVTMGVPQQIDGVYYTTWVEDPIPLAQAQQILLNQVAAYRAGITYKNVTFNSVSVPVDTQVIAILTVVAAGTQTIDFKGDDGWLSLAPADATALLAAIQTQVQTGFTNEKKHHDAIMALTTTADVAAYDITQGW